MGVNTTEGFSDRMEDIIISDGDFFSVGKGLYYFNMLSTLHELYAAENTEIIRLLGGIYTYLKTGAEKTGLKCALNNLYEREENENEPAD